MGHLINPISLQIKYHGSWKLSWNQYLRKDFSYFFFLDDYITKLIVSITNLKPFLKKFFFYELKYFIKNNTIFFIFSFKLLKKTRFRYYWYANRPFFKKFRLKFKERRVLRRRPNENYKKLYKKISFTNLKNKERYFRELYLFGSFLDENILLKKLRRVFSKFDVLRKLVMAVKLTKFNFGFFKYK